MDEVDKNSQNSEEEGSVKTASDGKILSTEENVTQSSDVSSVIIEGSAQKVDTIVIHNGEFGEKNDVIKIDDREKQEIEGRSEKNNVQKKDDSEKQEIEVGAGTADESVDIPTSYGNKITDGSGDDEKNVKYKERTPVLDKFRTATIGNSTGKSGIAEEKDEIEGADKISHILDDLGTSSGNEISSGTKEDVSEKICGTVTIVNSSGNSAISEKLPTGLINENDTGCENSSVEEKDDSEKPEIDRGDNISHILDDLGTSSGNEISSGTKEDVSEKICGTVTIVNSSGNSAISEKLPTGLINENDTGCENSSVEEKDESEKKEIEGGDLKLRKSAESEISSGRRDVEKDDVFKKETSSSVTMGQRNGNSEISDKPTGLIEKEENVEKKYDSHNYEKDGEGEETGYEIADFTRGNNGNKISSGLEDDEKDDVKFTETTDSDKLSTGTMEKISGNSAEGDNGAKSEKRNDKKKDDGKQNGIETEAEETGRKSNDVRTSIGEEITPCEDVKCKEMTSSLDGSVKAEVMLQVSESSQSYGEVTKTVIQKQGTCKETNITSEESESSIGRKSLIQSIGETSEEISIKPNNNCAVRLHGEEENGENVPALIECRNEDDPEISIAVDKILEGLSESDSVEEIMQEGTKKLFYVNLSASIENKLKTFEEENQVNSMEMYRLRKDNIQMSSSVSLSSTTATTTTATEESDDEQITIVRKKRDGTRKKRPKKDKKEK